MLVRRSIANGRCLSIANANNGGMQIPSAQGIRDEIQDLRLKRLFEFLDNFDGTDAEAAAKLGVQPGFFSQFKLDKKNKGRRSIGEVLARRMEMNAGLPRLWFDNVITADNRLTYRDLEFIRALRSMPDQTQASIESLVLGFAGQKREPDRNLDADISQRVVHESGRKFHVSGGSK